MAFRKANEMKLTDKFLRTVKPGPRFQDFTDDSAPLVARVKADGERLWFYRGKIDGVRTYRQIGVFPTMDTTEARATALALKSQARKAKVAPKPRAVRAAGVTVREAFALYERAHLAHIVSGEQVKGTMNLRILPAFGDRTLKSLTRSELNQHFNQMLEHYAGAGINRVLAHTKAFLNWCVREDMLEHNPAQMVSKKVKERPRKVVIRDHQLGYLQLALNEVGRYSDVLNLLLHAVCRLDDIKSLQWGDIIERDGGVELFIPDTKAGKNTGVVIPHIVPLTPSALRFIPKRPKEARDRDFVFDIPRGRMSGKIHAKIRKIATSYAEADRREFPDVTVHDYRTFASTYLADQRGRGKLVFSDRALDVLLAHIPNGVTAKHYNHSDALPERTAMLKAWSLYLDDCLASVRREKIRKAA